MRAFAIPLQAKGSRTSRTLVMTRDDDFRVRPGRIRHGGSRDGRSFVGQVLAAAQKAGGPSAARRVRSSVFGRQSA